MAIDPDELLHEAEDLIEDWLCELDETWEATLADARRQGDELRADAAADAVEIVGMARLEADSLHADARSALAQARLDADAIIAEAHATAGEHADVIRALNEAERGAVGEELVSLREAVSRLRTELSRLVDAAFDALPSVEATAEAIDRALGDEPEPVEAAPAPKRGRLRRIFSRS